MNRPPSHAERPARTPLTPTRGAAWRCPPPPLADARAPSAATTTAEAPSLAPGAGACAIPPTPACLPGEPCSRAGRDGGVRRSPPARRGRDSGAPQRRRHQQAEWPLLHGGETSNFMEVTSRAATKLFYNLKQTQQPARRDFSCVNCSLHDETVLC
ncbi:uncharacterized protein LJ264_008356 [Porphyrio hochstetteri]